MKDISFLKWNSATDWEYFLKCIGINKILIKSKVGGKHSKDWPLHNNRFILGLLLHYPDCHNYISSNRISSQEISPGTGGDNKGGGTSGFHDGEEEI